MVVKYEKAKTGYWFYYSIGNLDYAVVYPSKAAFIQAKGWNDIEFEPITEEIV